MRLKTNRVIKFKYLIILIFFFIRISFSYSQVNYQIEYKKIFRLDINNDACKNKQSFGEHYIVNRTFKEINEVLNKKHFYYSLLIDANNSSSFGVSDINVVSNLSKKELKALYKNSYGVFYTDLKTKKVNHYFNNHNVFLKIDEYKWNIKNNNKKILNYNCKKATTTYYDDVHDTHLRATAWFTDTIKQKTGPVGFGGLPGLILELEVEKILLGHKYIVVFKADNAVNKKNIIINEPVQGIETTYKNLDQQGVNRIKSKKM